MRDFWLGYWFKNWNFPYKIGYSIVITGSRTYFKNFKYLGKEKIPKNAGIIYAVNHQNAFLDPIVIAGQTNNPINFLARADIFKNKFVYKLLRSVYMLPIYRQRDGVDTIEKNQKTFEDCYEILKNNGHLIIFPEGNHNSKKKLRTLKKGVSRIALGTLSKYGKDIPLYIVPIGIDYDNHFNMNSDVLLNVGEPININNYFDEYVKTPVEILKKLTDQVRENLESVLIHIKDDENYDEIYYLLHRFSLNNETELEKKFTLRNSLLSKLEWLKENEFRNFEKLLENVKVVRSFVKENKIRPYLLKNSPLSFFKIVVFSLIMMIVLPLHLILLTTNYLPYKIPVWFVENKIKDRTFHGSLKQAIGVILFIIYWFLLVLFTYIFFGKEIGLLLIFLLPICAILNFKYWILMIKLKGAWSYRRAIKKEKFNSAIKAFNYINKKLGI
ncbi:MAG: hypothetical protein CL821_05995 [Crocinitomicaceae bacterium]|nr:hypothetical protein [Crocinitomicaceae bacterium]|tara:strand:+ start:3809 stop:5134 length:1326 start_codon:yes stop_codon:yes gene_type:complete